MANWMSALLLLFPLSSAIMLPPAGGDHRTLSGTRGRVSAFAGPAWPAPAVKWCFRCARPRPGEKAALRMRGGGDQDHQGGATVQQPSAGQARRMPWGVIYGIGFGAITASRIAHEAHLQAFYLNIIPPNLVGAGWTLFCAAVALAEPTIGVMLDKLRAAGIRQTTVLRTLLLPWLVSVYLIWAPFTSNPVALLVPVLIFGALQATLNLSLLSIYPSLFPTPADRAKALVPQQVMTISGLLLGMTLPAILSDDWRDPAAFSRLFVMGLGLVTFVSSTLLSRFKPGEIANSELAGQQEEGGQGGGLSEGAGGGKGGRKLPGNDTRGSDKGQAQKGGVFDNPAFRLLLLNVFLCQVGNALLASTQPIFARYVIDLSTPVGPFFYGLVPLLDAKWQFSVCYLIFYTMGALSGPMWARRNALVGPVRTLRLALACYAMGCFLIPLLPGGVLAASLSCLSGGMFGTETMARMAVILTLPLAKFLLFALVYMWNGFCLGGMVALPDLIVAEAVKRDEQEQLEQAVKDGRAPSSVVSRAGAMYGAKQLLYRMASATQGIITAFIMSLCGFAPALASQTLLSKAGLCALVGWIPGILYVGASLVLTLMLRLDQPRSST